MSQILLRQRCNWPVHARTWTGDLPKLECLFCEKHPIQDQASRIVCLFSPLFFLIKPSGILSSRSVPRIAPYGTNQLFSFGTHLPPAAFSISRNAFSEKLYQLGKRQNVFLSLRMHCWNKRPPQSAPADRNGLLFFPHDSKGKAFCIPPEKHWNDLLNR